MKKETKIASKDLESKGMSQSHVCNSEERLDSIEEKLDKIDEKLEIKLDKIDDKLEGKFDIYNELLKEHISRTAILETRQEAYDKNQVETKDALKELRIITDEVKMMKAAFLALKKPFWFIISIILFFIFKGDDTFISFISFIKGFFGS